MVLSRRQRRLSLWLTLVAMVLATLAPGISRAKAFVDGESAPWALVCSVMPGATAAGGAGGPTDPAGSRQATGVMGEHCPFCMPRADLLAPPPTLPPMALGAVTHADPPPLFLWAPRPLHAWCSAQPRAPPALS